MPDLDVLFNNTATAAKAFNGSRRIYNNFFRLALVFEQAGGEPAKIDHLLQEAIDSFYRYAGDTFLKKLKKGGTQIFEHESVFVKPDSLPNGIIRTGEGGYEGPIFEARLLDIIRLLQTHNIFTDDLILDLGYVNAAQMRKQPYNILTVKPLNAQIAIADQYGEAFFVAKPSIEFSEWERFQKNQAGERDTPFENIHKIIRKGNWREALLNALAEEPDTEPSVKPFSGDNPEYHLTEDMIVRMAFFHRFENMDKNLPTARSGNISRRAIEVATGDPSWPDEKWSSINNALYEGTRGLPSYGGLNNFLKTQKTSIARLEAMEAAVYRTMERTGVSAATLLRLLFPRPSV